MSVVDDYGDADRFFFPGPLFEKRRGKDRISWITRETLKQLGGPQMLLIEVCASWTPFQVGFDVFSFRGGEFIVRECQQLLHSSPTTPKVPSSHLPLSFSTPVPSGPTLLIIGSDKLLFRTSQYPSNFSFRLPFGERLDLQDLDNFLDPASPLTIEQ